MNTAEKIVSFDTMRGLYEQKHGLLPSHSLTALQIVSEASTASQDSAHQLQTYLLNAWKANRQSRRHSEKSISQAEAIVMDLCSHANTSLHLLNELHFERWCAHLGIERGLAPACQRKYQSTIRSLFKYLTGSEVIVNYVKQQAKVTLRQFCTEDNCIPHVHDRELSTERRAMTHDELDLLFDSIDRAILEAKNFRTKSLYPLLRTKFAIYLAYLTGLRADTVVSLTLDSFEPNPLIPEMGSYGIVKGFTKGSKGSGPKPFRIPLCDPDFVKLMEFYLKEIRPKLTSPKHPNQRYLLLSERGSKLSYQSFYDMFGKSLEFANLDGIGLCPHSLRHSSVSHKLLLYSLETVRKLHNHSYASTTQIYSHIGEETTMEELRSLLSALCNIDQEVSE